MKGCRGRSCTLHRHVVQSVANQQPSHSLVPSPVHKLSNGGGGTGNGGGGSKRKTDHSLGIIRSCTIDIGSNDKRCRHFKAGGGGGNRHFPEFGEPNKRRKPSK